MLLERRPIVIASILAVVFLAALVAETVRDLLVVPTMDKEIECMLHRNCLVVEPNNPLPPLIAPRLTSQRPIQPTQKRAERSKDQPHQQQHPERATGR